MLINQMQVGLLLLGPQAQVRLSNSVACDLLGLNKSELHYFATLSGLGWDVIHLDGTPFSQENYPITQALQSGCAMRNVIMGVHRSQQDRIWLLIDVEPQVGADGCVEQIVCILRDLSILQQAEEEISALKRQNQLILNSAGEGIYGLDLQGHTTFANPAAARMVGWELKELIGKPQHLMVHHSKPDGTPYPQKDCPIYAALKDGAVHHVNDEVFWRKDGTSFPVEYVSTPIRERGELVGAVVVFRDITERVQAKQVLEQAYNELELRVEQRTAELAQANTEIVALNDRLKAENLRMRAELEVTRQLQQMILPKERELNQIMELDIASFMEPALEVGGDYYDVLQHNGTVKIGIGDVTGHGLESGVLMLMVQTAVRTLLVSGETNPTKFLDVINRTIYGNVQRMHSDKNLTLCLLDYQQGTLSLSGQHEEIIVVRGGSLELIDTIDLGFPIGLEANITDFVAQTQIQLIPGDVVVLYTDGITEAEDMQGIQYGLERLCDIVSCNWQQSAQEIQRTVVEDLRRHIGEQRVYDDITLLVVKQK